MISTVSFLTVVKQTRKKWVKDFMLDYFEI